MQRPAVLIRVCFIDDQLYAFGYFIYIFIIIIALRFND